MRLADVGVLGLIFMLLARILAPIAIVYILPGTAVADEAVRLIEATADASFLMLLIALLMFWTIKKRWRPGLWVSLACAIGFLVLSCTALIYFVYTLSQPSTGTIGWALLPPRVPPEAKTFSEAALQALGSLAHPAKAFDILMILALLVPSLVLVVGLLKGLRGNGGVSQ